MLVFQGIFNYWHKIEHLRQEELREMPWRFSCSKTEIYCANLTSKNKPQATTHASWINTLPSDHWLFWNGWTSHLWWNSCTCMYASTEVLFDLGVFSLNIMLLNISKPALSENFQEDKLIQSLYLIICIKTFFISWYLWEDKYNFIIANWHIFVLILLQFLGHLSL